MRPRSIILFERALWTALALDLVNNLTTWPKLAARLAASGVAPNPLLLFAACAASPAIGLLLWYFIARRASIVAKWILTVLVAFAVAGFGYVLAHPVAPGARALLALAALAELLKVFAVTRLFTADAAPWFARRDAA